jgi:hypothetical protein
MWPFASEQSGAGSDGGDQPQAYLCEPGPAKHEGFDACALRFSAAMQ